MALSVDWATGLITIPKADLTLVSGSLYELDTDAFRLELKGLEASSDGMAFLDSHRHNTEVTVAGTTFARTIEIINGYSVQFELSGTYAVRLAGSNNNLFDAENGILVPTAGVTVIAQNSAGLVSTSDATAAAVWNASLEAGVSYESAMRIVLAALAGKLSGAATTSIAIRDVNDTKTRIAATVDADGNRTAVTLDGS